MSFYTAPAILLQQIRALSPLVLNISNLVVMNLTANALLACGASALMSHALEEVEELAGKSSSLLLNIGTLEPEWVKAMHLALSTAKSRRIPVVLDPVGAGASAYRTRTALQLLEAGGITIIHGNASEILALSGQESSSKGVDSGQSSSSALEAAYELALRHTCTVCVSGSLDFVLNPTGQAYKIAGGSRFMSMVTGMGCTASALSAAFAAVGTNDSQATVGAMLLMAGAGHQAESACAGPGSFVPFFLDGIHAAQARDMDRYAQAYLSVHGLLNNGETLATDGKQR